MAKKQHQEKVKCPMCSRRLLETNFEDHFETCKLKTARRIVDKKQELASIREKREKVTNRIAGLRVTIRESEIELAASERVAEIVEGSEELKKQQETTKLASFKKSGKAKESLEKAESRLLKLVRQEAEVTSEIDRLEWLVNLDGEEFLIALEQRS